MNARPCGRFAPSPSGRLHLGSLVAALGSWLFAHAAGGRWLVRIEDLDREREVASATRHIIATLAAFGLHPDAPVVRQSTRTGLYRAALQRLAEAGHAYRCWCSRSDLEPLGGIHPPTCVARPGPREPAWRLRVGEACLGFDDRICGPYRQQLATAVGDFVIWRADGACAYQLAVVVDDAAQGITEVVRGADLLDSTPRQLLLQRLLGLPQPSYAHLPLVLDAQGRKLSKHEDARPVEAGAPLPALRAALRVLGQQVASAGSVADVLAHALRTFDAERIPASRAPDDCRSA
ncbi:MAG: tRNA glutamyl-Q(34) synthetase GluQRS [Dokdonella sp.]|nr:MAG: tRNA glutamyl-Q(34) synthetase GluQRS [Dokdonella sp.]